jgi:ABC-type nitrate/sulfonate/bicarbonate transport system permease component
MRIRLIIPVLLFLLGWEVVSRSGMVNPALFPAPSRVWLALVQLVQSGSLGQDIAASSSRLIAGLLLGSTVGIGLGLLTGRMRFVSDIFSPLIGMFRPLPPVAIIPLVIVWLGIGETAKIFSIAFAVFFPVWLNTDAGVRQVPVKFLWSASTLTNSRAKVFFSVVLPASLPSITSGVRLGISVAFVMVFVAELAGASSGLGYEIATANLAYRIDRMVAALVVLGASGALADFLFVKGVYRACPWLKLSERT